MVGVSNPFAQAKGRLNMGQEPIQFGAGATAVLDIIDVDGKLASRVLCKDPARLRGNVVSHFVGRSAGSRWWVGTKEWRGPK